MLLIESKQRAKIEKLEIARWKVWAYLQSKSKKKISLESVLPLHTDAKPQSITKERAEQIRDEFLARKKSVRDGTLIYKEIGKIKL